MILKRKSLYTFFGAKNFDYNRFAIVCTSRSGSTWLHTLLNSHPQVTSKGEIVFKTHKLNKDLDLEADVFHQYASSIKAVGLKVFYGLTNDIYEPTLQALRRDSEIKIIHLVRENRLAQFVSLQAAKRNSEWSHKGTSKTQPIRIELADFQQFNEKQINLQTKIDQDFKGRILNISYEDLLSRQNETLVLVQEFLGVKHRKLFSALKRQSTSDLKGRIANWSDFEGFYLKD